MATAAGSLALRLRQRQPRLKGTPERNLRVRVQGIKLHATYKGIQMKSTFARCVCRILVASMIGLPFQAQAGVIGTEQAVAAAHEQAARVTVAGFIDRADVALQLQSLGLAAKDAKARVAALTDAEVAAIANRIDSLPAGANGGGLGILLVIAFLIWRFVFSDQAKAEAAKPAPKPAPAPEKK